MTARVPSQAARDAAERLLFKSWEGRQALDVFAEHFAAFEADLIDRLVLTSNEVKAGKVGSEAAPDDVERVARAIYNLGHADVMSWEEREDDHSWKAGARQYARAAITALTGKSS